MMFERDIVKTIGHAIQKKSSVIHCIIGPRQVGKTTAAKQLGLKLKWHVITGNADSPISHGSEWIETHFFNALHAIKKGMTPTLLVLDEIQKVKGWSETLKSLWDRHIDYQGSLRILILGSSSLHVQKGLTESLAGRFFLHRFTHWTYAECAKAFGWDLDQWLYFGGYPGAYAFIDNETQWKHYIRDSLIETVISKDVLQLDTITKPALLRQLFLLSTAYPSHVLSYNKMLGQLHDAGNTTTLAHYLTLLEKAFLLSGLSLYTGGEARRRASSPKLIIWNNALVNAVSLHHFSDLNQDPIWKGWIIENAVGAHLLNHLQGIDWQVHYWRDQGAEVDFVITHGHHIWALEVKSGKTGKVPGIQAFKEKYPQAHTLLIGGNGIPLDDFFTANITDLLTATL